MYLISFCYWSSISCIIKTSPKWQINHYNTIYTAFISIPCMLSKRGIFVNKHILFSSLPLYLASHLSIVFQGNAEAYVITGSSRESHMTSFTTESLRSAEGERAGKRNLRVKLMPSLIIPHKPSTRSHCVVMIAVESFNAFLKHVQSVR